MKHVITRISVPGAILVLWMAFLNIGVAQAQSNGRPANCRVETGGKVEVNGACRFSNEAGGSFTLENTERSKPLFGEVLVVSVSIVSPDVADVRGATRQGINSRWGTAHRSATDRACWEGSDFKVCAR